MSSNSRKIIAIHQPNFFPWLGYFDKIVKSDVFVFLDNVQFPKTGGTWINRVKLLVNGVAAWVTVPVIRNYSGLRLVHEMKINNLTDWRGKLLKTIQTNYAKAPYYKQTISLISELIDNPDPHISDLNIQVITKLCLEIGIDTGKLVKGSTIGATGNSSELLIAITKTVGGEVYMCGGGAGGYQEDAKFPASGIELRYQAFSHPEYVQTKAQRFVPGLSVLDAVFNVGFEGVAELLAR